MSEVLYRRWRPQSFAEVVGQDPVTRTLRNSVAQDRLAHAYLLCGPRGTGKTTLGRLIAKTANCDDPAGGEPCNECASCMAFNEGRAMDFVEQDAASHNSVDDIRQLRENVVLTPMAGGRKVYLLDEVHMLSRGAHNALLKTLEEPPPHVIFVLATTEPHKVEPTIISRCQRFDLKRIANTVIAERLGLICKNEGFELDKPSLEAIARSSNGGLRDAINALEQVITYYGKSPAYEQVQEALGLNIDARAGQFAKLAVAGFFDSAQDTPSIPYPSIPPRRAVPQNERLGEGLKLLAAVRDDGVDMRQFARQTVQYLRGMLLAKAGASESLDLPVEMAEEVRKEGAGVDRGEIVRALRTFGRLDFRDDPLSALPLELAFIEFVSERPPAPAPATPVAAEPSRSRASSGPAVPSRERPWAAAAPEGPARSAAPTAADGSAGDLLDRVRAACKEADRSLAALLNGSCEVKSVEDESVVLAFYHTFHLERVESEPNAGKLRDLFSKTMGRPVQLVFEHAPRTRPSREGPGQGGHLVQAARELGVGPVTTPSDEGGSDG